jgi:hypothetical protein
MNRRTLFFQVLIVSILCIILVALAVSLRVFVPKSTSHRITFRVESSGGIANITYKDKKNLQKERLQISTPWERSWDNPSGTEVYLTVGNPTQIGSIKCFLKVDGKSWKMDSATSPDDSVACAGIVP